MPCITSLAPRIHFVVVSVRNRCNQRGFAAVIKPGFGVAINAVKCLLRITTVVCRAVQVVWGGGESQNNCSLHTRICVYD